MKPAKNALILITLVVAALLSACGNDRTKANEILLRAASPFEDMVEFALAKDEAGIAKSLAAAASNTAAVRDTLPPAATAQFDPFLQTIRGAAAAKGHYAVAQSAVEVYRLLIDNLDAKSLTVPKEVSLLDYAGFKLHVLAAAPQPDWAAMRRTVDDAAGWWAAIKPKVEEKSLLNAFNSAVVGLQQAAKAEHLPMLNFAAQINLDLVDLLEGYFERKK